jgi:hypothetical protein
MQEYETLNNKLTIYPIFLLSAILTCWIIVCGQNTASQETKKTKSKFSLSITTFVYAERLFNGETTYDLKNDTLMIYKKFRLTGEDTFLYYKKKIDNHSVSRLKNIRLDSLDDYYDNYCIFRFSGSEYYISTSLDSVKKDIRIHSYYNKQIERFINELNNSIPEEFKIHYVSKIENRAAN